MRRFWTLYERTCQWLLLLPFLLVQAIGPGAMPQISADGIEIVLCSDGDLKHGTIDANGEFHEGGEDHFSPCYWAITGAPLVETAAVQLPSPTDIWTSTAVANSDRIDNVAPFHALPPARAPPLTV